MAVSPPARAAVLLLLALVLVITGSWLATSSSTASPGPQSGRAGTLITYHGTEARAVLPLRADRLPGAPDSFRKFVKKQLHRMWDILGSYPNCKTSPQVIVHAIRTDGFALGAVIERPRGAHCDGGGGHAAIWAIRHGEWKEVVGTQDEWPCSRLEKFGIPSEIGVHECYDGQQLVPYDHP